MFTYLSLSLPLPLSLSIYIYKEREIYTYIPLAPRGAPRGLRGGAEEVEGLYYNII